MYKKSKNIFHIAYYLNYNWETTSLVKNNLSKSYVIISKQAAKYKEFQNKAMTYVPFLLTTIRQKVQSFSAVKDTGFPIGKNAVNKGIGARIGTRKYE